MNPTARRVVAAVGANSFGQATIIVMQLTALPIFLGKWDAATYGTWLMLAAIPAYLSITDGGLVLAAANKATMQVSQNDLPGANRTFQSAFAFLLLAALAIFLIALLSVYIVGIPGVSEKDQKDALMLLVTGVIAAQFNGLAEVALRATNRYAKGIMLGNISRLLEFMGWVVGLYALGSFTGVALAGLSFRLVGLATSIYISKKENEAISWGLSCSHAKECRELLKPGVHFMAFPLANALSIQGSTLIIGHTLGPAIVTVFNTYRTLSRVALQVTMVLGNSLWAEFSKLFATRSYQQLGRLYRHAILASVLISSAICTIVFLLSSDVIKLWSRGLIQYDPLLLLLMLTWAMAGATWNIPRILLMSTNSHGSLSTQAIIGAILTTLLTIAGTAHFGVYGAASSVIIVEFALATACSITARRLLERLKRAPRL